MPSIQQHPQLVGAHVQAESGVRPLLDPLPSHLSCLVQTSPIGLIPKSHQPEKWRLIINLSSLAGKSVNYAIAPDYCHMQYASVLDAARIVQQLGQVLSWQSWTSTMPTTWYLPTQTTTACWVYTGVRYIYTALPGSSNLEGLLTSHQPHYLDDFL